jgi:hypothetical protein
MTTFYTETPTFEERVSAATLVILGRVEEAVDATTDYMLEQPQVRTTFRVNIESVLKGRIDAPAVHVQIAGGKTDEAETAWSVQLREGESALLMLSPNYARRAPEVFVPYFESVYPVTPEGNVELSEDVAKQLADQNISVERATATLADLRALVDAVARRQEEQEVLLAELEPPDLRRMPYGEVLEMPQPDFGGARSATPDD